MPLASCSTASSSSGTSASGCSRSALPTRRATQALLTRNSAPALLAADRRRRSRCHRLHLSQHHRGAGPPAPRRAPGHSGLRGDHRSRRTRLLGESRHRRPPRHPPRVDSGGAADRRDRDRDPLRARLPRPEFRTPRDAAQRRARALGSARTWIDRARLRAAAGASATWRGGRDGARRGARDAGRLPVRAQRRRSTGASRRASPASRAFASSGFTDRMPEWMAAADVLVHSTVRADRARSADARLRRGLVRVGTRAHPPQRRCAPPLRARRPSPARERARAALATRARSTHGDPIRVSPTSPRPPRSCSRPRSATAAAADAAQAARRARRSPAPPRWTGPRRPRSCPRVAERLGIPCRLARAARRRAHLRRRPPPRGHTGDARGARRRRRDGDVLPRRRAGRALAGGRRRDRRRRARDRHPRLPPPPAAAPPGRVARERPRPRLRRHRLGHRARAEPLSAALRRVLERRARGSCAGAAGSRCSGRPGDATGARARRRRRSPVAPRATSAPATSCCCTTPITTARRTPGAERSPRSR